jgi:hypothetical protein
MNNYPSPCGRGGAKGRGEVLIDTIDLIPHPLLPRGEGVYVILFEPSTILLIKIFFFTFWLFS